MSSTYFSLIVFVVLILNSGFTPVSDWETKRESGNVKLQYRWVKDQDDQEYREFRAELTISSSLPSFLRNINEEKRIAQWTARSKACKVYDKTAGGWITYTLFDIPWPFTQQDLVLKHTLHYENGNLIVTLKPLPDYLPRQKDVTRLDEYNGYWKIIPEGTDHIQVEFYYLSTKKPVLPRFIMDPILQNMLMESFTKLIALSEAS